MPALFRFHERLAALVFAIVIVATCSQSISWSQSPSESAGVLTTDCTEIERRVPPLGLEISAQQWTDWMSQIKALETRLMASGSELKADVAVLLKACRYAVEFRELYQEKDFAKVDRLLVLAAQRLDELESLEGADGSDFSLGGRPSWVAGEGRQVRGFISKIDSSPQPLGVLLPDGWQQADKLMPLYIWLHGRGDKTTDVHFLCERLDKDGQIKPSGAIVIHPFGRQCIGYKSAGETDVMEAIDFALANYPVDPQRIVLMGFSMGGAGAWHIAAHYGERFVAASAGAGFVDVAQYQKLKAEDFPPKYEQMLWGIYDVPGYTRNLFNLPFVAYSGELDRQIQAARQMEAAFASEGRELTHLIGPGMGHKYHPDTLQEIMERMAAAAEAGKSQQADQFFIQSKHPRYSSRRWLTIDGPIKQYENTQVTATLANATWQLETQNAQRLTIDLAQADAPQGSLEVDNQQAQLSRMHPLSPIVRLELVGGKWKQVERFHSLRKQPKLSGPIDDAFIEPFLVVLPTGKSDHPRVEQWVRCELENLQERWKTLFRGQLRTKLDTEVTLDDMAKFHLVLWGDPSSNRLIARVLANESAPLPIRWSTGELQMESEIPASDEAIAKSFDADSHVPLAIYPNPLQPNRYVVLNSGPTFRQAHDRTNSLQNPHLPDWAILSLDTRPSDERAGRVVAAGFFNDRWQFVGATR